MNEQPTECNVLHCRLMKCALEVDNSRAYWQHLGDSEKSVSAQRAFSEFWFGARSLARIEMLLAHLRWRFDRYPSALQVLSFWREMDPDTRRLICHWHLQLSDPLYRTFTGNYLVARRDTGRVDVTRDLVITWVGDQAPERWTIPTRVKFATKLLHAAHAAGLVASTRDPRQLCNPRISDDGLSYLMYLLKEVHFAGTLLENPYLASVGLEGAEFDRRLRGLKCLDFKRQGDLVDFGWRYSSLLDWANACLRRIPLIPIGVT